MNLRPILDRYIQSRMSTTSESPKAVALAAYAVAQGAEGADFWRLGLNACSKGCYASRRPFDRASSEPDLSPSKITSPPAKRTERRRKRPSSRSQRPWAPVKRLSRQKSTVREELKVCGTNGMLPTRSGRKIMATSCLPDEERLSLGCKTVLRERNYRGSQGKRTPSPLLGACRARVSQVSWMRDGGWSKLASEQQTSLGGVSFAPSATRICWPCCGRDLRQRFLGDLQCRSELPLAEDSLQDFPA